MMNETNDVFTMEDEPIASVMQDMRKGSKWLSAFLESYRPPLDGERYLTDGEVAELLRVSRRTLQEYRNNETKQLLPLQPGAFCEVPAGIQLDEIPMLPTPKEDRKSVV